MAKIQIRLRQINLIKAPGDGLLGGGTLELYPLLRINSSVNRVSILGSRYNDLKSGVYDFNNLLFEVEIPLGEFAEFNILFFESDNNGDWVEKLKNEPIKPLGKYEITKPNLAKEALAQTIANKSGRSGIDENGNPFTEFWIDGDEGNLAFVALILAFLKSLVSGGDKDDYFGSWRTKIEVLAEGVFIASKGVGPDSAIDVKQIPDIVKLDGLNETAIPTLSYWKHDKFHVEFSLTAQVVG